MFFKVAPVYLFFFLSFPSQVNSITQLFPLHFPRYLGNVSNGKRFEPTSRGNVIMYGLSLNWVCLWAIGAGTRKPAGFKSLNWIILIADLIDGVRCGAFSMTFCLTNSSSNRAVPDRYNRNLQSITTATPSILFWEKCACHQVRVPQAIQTT